MNTGAAAVLLAGRILFAALFAFSARGHIQNHARYAAIARGKLPLPMVAGWPTGVYLLAAAASIAAGVWPDVGSLMIALFLIPAALLFHPFWTVSDPVARRTQEGGFYRDVTLLGAALCLFALFAVVGHAGFAFTDAAINLR
jgi:putative oxidoreductase